MFVNYDRFISILYKQIHALILNTMYKRLINISVGKIYQDNIVKVHTSGRFDER